MLLHEGNSDFCSNATDGRIAGAEGMLVAQAYFIFSIGNIRPLITAEYPECWKTYEQCSKTLTQAPDYTQIIGTLPLPGRQHMLSQSS